MPLNSVHKLDCFFLISFPFACPALEIEEVSSGCTRVSVGTGVTWDCSDYSAWLSRAMLIILNLSAWLKKKKKKSLSHVRLFTTLWTVVCQAPLSMGFSRQEYWSGLPCPLPGDLPDLGSESGSPELQADSLPSEPNSLANPLEWYYPLWNKQVIEGQIWHNSIYMRYTI